MSMNRFVSIKKKNLMYIKSYFFTTRTNLFTEYADSPRMVGSRLVFLNFLKLTHDTVLPSNREYLHAHKTQR